MRATGLDAATETFLAACQAKVTAHYESQSWPRNTVPTLRIDEPRGSRYWRVVSDSRDSGGGRSVYCFIDTTTGAVLKAGGWKQPAANPVRGSVFNSTGADACDWHGCRYLK